MDAETSKGFGPSKVTENSVFSDSLNIFEGPSIDSDILKGRNVVFRPLSENNEGPYEFSLDSQGENQYLQLNSVRLGGRCQITLPDGNELPETEDLSIVNMFPSSLFQGTETKFNNTIITDLTSNLSHYQSYMQTLCSYNKNAMETHLQGQMYIPDEPGKYDKLSFDSSKLVALESNRWTEDEFYIQAFDEKTKKKVMEEINSTSSDELKISASGREFLDASGKKGTITSESLTLSGNEMSKLAKQAKKQAVEIMTAYVASAKNLERCNKGYINRRKIMQKSKIFDFYIPLCSDIFHSDKFLHPSISLKLLLRRSSPGFSILSNETKAYKIEVSNLKLYTRYVQVNDSIIKKHKMMISENKAIRYPITRTSMKSFNIPRDNASMYVSSMFTGILPKTLIIGMVENEAFYGKQQKNPYNFQHFGLKHAHLRVNGETVPSESIAPEFSKDIFMREYIDFYRNIGIDICEDSGNMITPQNYKSGAFLMAFDLSGEQCNQLHRHKTLMGNIDFEGSFERALTKTITLVVFASTDAEICVGPKGPFVEYRESKTPISAP